MGSSVVAWSALQCIVLIICYRIALVAGQLDLPPSPETQGLRPKYFREMEVEPMEQQNPVSHEVL